WIRMTNRSRQRSRMWRHRIRATRFRKVIGDMDELAPPSPSRISGRLLWIISAVLIGVAGAAAPHLIRHNPLQRDAATSIGPAVGMPGAPPTTASGLQERIQEMERRLRERPDDVNAAVLLADALLRQARSTTDGRPANRASEVLKTVLTEDPTQYDALRML